jgi:pimeloyl-ACP methyl ester carboxylesterase
VNLEFLHSKAAAPSSSRRAKAAHGTILFVHGAYCGAWIWADNFLPYFSAQGWDCYAVSLRGHGGSEGSLTWSTLADYVDDVEAAVDRVGGPVVLIGHSMGGLVVQHYLARTGKAAGVRAAALLAAVPPSGVASSAMHMSMIAPDLLWQLGLLQTLGPEAVSPRVIHRAFLSPDTPIEAVQGLLPKMQKESNRVATDLMSPPQPIPPPLDQRPPILVIGGDADAFLPVSAFRETATYWNAELKILQGAPHGIMIDSVWWQPAADTIIEWLEAKAAG